MIDVNEKWEIPWHAGMTVGDVLVACKFTHQQIVVSVNSMLVPPDAYDTRTVADGDKVRVIHVIGGG
jgi:sulfur carrier protein